MSLVYRKMMSGKFRILWVLIAVAAAVLVWKGPQWLAFEKGVRAYLYAYPLVIADMTERLMTAPSAIAAQKPGAAPVNRLAHLRDYPDKNFTAVVIPNADTLYSVAWLDLSGEPVLLHTPDMQGRWVLFGVLDAWSNAFASLGTRNYGSAERTYALVGPGWSRHAARRGRAHRQSDEDRLADRPHLHRGQERLRGRAQGAGPVFAGAPVAIRQARCRAVPGGHGGPDVGHRDACARASGGTRRGRVLRPSGAVDERQSAGAG